jgi:hypothetical protein
VAKRKTRVRSHVVADMSLFYFGLMVTSCGFSVTILSGQADYGYDLNINTFDDQGQIENGFMLVQPTGFGCRSVHADTTEQLAEQFTTALTAQGPTAIVVQTQPMVAHLG